MTTPARIEANRRNARRSTGPRTQAGKARVASNAFRHGLAVPVAALPEFHEGLKQLTVQIAGGRTSTVHLQAASQIAEATLDLQRITAVRQLLVEKLAAAVTEGEVKEVSATTHALLGLDRYERRALSRRKSAVCFFDTLG